MNFFIPDNIVFSLSNEVKNFEFKKIKKFKEYKIDFTSNFKYPLNLNIKIKHFYLGNTIKESFLSCNDSITLSNYYLTKLSFEFLNVESFKECIDFKVEIIEIQKNFNLEIPKNSKKIDEFINLIEKQDPMDSPKTFSCINIASILDEFSYECFNPDVNLINLNYESCLDEIKYFNPDFLFVESVWKGKNNSWENKIASTNDFIDSKLLKLIDYCKNKNIPTVFWNKEGLINLKYFKLISLLFDYIFVTDENIIKEYISEYNCENIQILEFAAQPKLHNSINKNKYKLGDIAFTGSWYGNKHQDRLLEMEYILKPSLQFDLDIFDRNFKNKNKLTYLNLYWPDEYIDNIVGSLNYNFLIHAYKNYSLFLNVNSIVNSKHMASRRVYEILCSKTPVLSSNCKCLQDNFYDKVFISNSSEKTIHSINYILNNQFEIKKLSKKNQRFILENHTYKNRLEHIFNTLKVNYTKEKILKVFIIGICKTYDSFFNLYENINNQSYRYINYIILVSKKISKYLNNIDISKLNICYCDFDNNNDINVEINNLILENNEIDYFSIFYSNYNYGKNYIRDYINTLSFVNAKVLGKNKFLIGFNKKNKPFYFKCDAFIDSYTSSIFLFTLFIERKTLLEIIYEIDFLKSIIISNKTNNFKIYSDDEFNFSASKNLFKLVNI